MSRVMDELTSKFHGISKYDDYVIPAGTSIMMNICESHGSSGETLCNNGLQGGFHATQGRMTTRTPSILVGTCVQSSELKLIILTPSSIGIPSILAAVE